MNAPNENPVCNHRAEDYKKTFRDILATDFGIKQVVKKQHLSQFLVQQFPISRIHVELDNSRIYDRFGIANSDDYELAMSIHEHGIQEPLVLSTDLVLLSGHRRLAAAKYIGLDAVPVRIHNDLFYRILSKDEKLETLSRFNKQREKSPDERIREKLIEIDPEEAHSKLLRMKVDRLTLKGAIKSNVAMGQIKRRARITAGEFIDAAKKVIEQNKRYWPLTVRRYHYLLLNHPPLKHDKKPDSQYVNDAASYKALTNLLLRARLAGEVPFEAIEDSTRPIQLGGGFSSFEEFVGEQTEYFLTGYSRNLMQGQHCHIEIMLEKNAIRTVIEEVAREYCIPITTGRGYASLSPRYDLYQRYIQSGKSRLVLLMLTDFDPDGDEIAASFARSLRDDFGLKNIHPVKVALTAEDVNEYDLPSDMDAKLSSPNYKKFVAKYGSTKVVELDACPVELLQSKLREAINNVIDVDAYNAQIELEKKDAANIEAYRRVVFDAIKGGK